jgi:hypothetical protein
LNGGRLIAGAQREGQWDASGNAAAPPRIGCAHSCSERGKWQRARSGATLKLCPRREG